MSRGPTLRAWVAHCTTLCGAIPIKYSWTLDLCSARPVQRCSGTLLLLEVRMGGWVGQGWGHKQLTSIFFKILFPYLRYDNPTPFLTESPWGLNKIMHTEWRLQGLAHRGCWVNSSLYHLVFSGSRVCFAVKWALNAADLIWEGSGRWSYLRTRTCFIETLALIDRNSVLNCCWKVRNLIWESKGDVAVRNPPQLFLAKLRQTNSKIMIVVVSIQLIFDTGGLLKSLNSLFRSGWFTQIFIILPKVEVRRLASSASLAAEAWVMAEVGSTRLVHRERTASRGGRRGGRRWWWGGISFRASAMVDCLGLWGW